MIFKLKQLTIDDYTKILYNSNVNEVNLIFDGVKGDVVNAVDFYKGSNILPLIQGLMVHVEKLDYAYVVYKNGLSSITSLRFALDAFNFETNSINTSIIKNLAIGRV